MKLLIIAILSILTTSSVFSQTNDNTIKFENLVLLDTINGIYIPQNIDDCIVQINSFWSDSIKNTVKGMTENEFTATAHMGIGMWIRNNWFLWNGSRLSVYFNTLGIYHPDDMSGIIITSYYRNLTQHDIELKSQIKKYTDYWKQQEQNTNQLNKESTKEILKSKKWLKRNKLKFKVVEKLLDRQLYFNCASDIVLKKISGDTIMYWTTSAEIPYEPNKLKEQLGKHKKDFQENAYVKELYHDGRIIVAYLHERDFIFHNDTLFEKDYYHTVSMDSLKILFSLAAQAPSEKDRESYFDIIGEVTLSDFKLIFTPSMFETEQTVKPNYKHFENDEISLSGYWNINNIKYYKITITNDIEMTKYSYIFDENGRFVEWENCKDTIINKLTENYQMPLPKR
jgi:hypothetical protein